MTQDEARKALDTEAGRLLAGLFHKLCVDLNGVAKEKPEGEQEALERFNNGVEVIAQASEHATKVLENLAFDGTIPAIPQFPTESDEALRYRLRGSIGAGTVWADRIDRAAGVELDKIASYYGVERGKPYVAKKAS